jgi:hypothetical protein
MVEVDISELLTSRLERATAFITAIGSIAKYSGCARARRELAAVILVSRFRSS